MGRDPESLHRAPGALRPPGTKHFFPEAWSVGRLRSQYNFLAAVVEKVAPSVVHLQLFRR